MGSRMVYRWGFAVALCLLLPGRVLAQPTTLRVSVGPGGAQGNDGSWGPAISDDGRWVAFKSSASNLVAGDTNATDDVFVHDQQAGITTRASLGFAGVQADGGSDRPAISADGRWVAFESWASNLVAGDTNGQADVFVRDLQTGTTTRVSVGSAGTQANSSSGRAAVSADGRWVAFESHAGNLVAGDTNNTLDVFVHDQQTGMTMRVSVGPAGAQGNGWSEFPSISADGRFVAFDSAASNLVAGDTNGTYDVFVHDRQLATTTRVSVGLGGAETTRSSLFPSISDDGRSVAYLSGATNLVAGDTNGWQDVFVYDAQAGATTRVSLGPGGAQGNGDSLNPAISADGRWVAFISLSSNLVVGDTNDPADFDVFVHDRLTATTARVSVGPGGVEANRASGGATISADGRSVAFDSDASNLVTADTNFTSDVFVYTRGIDLPPEAPTGLAASVVGNIVTLRWSIPPGGPRPTNFALEGGFAPGETLASVLTGSPSPVFVVAAPTGSFYLRLRAVNGTARSAPSNEILVHVGVPVAPSAPANLLGLVDDTTLTLAWTNTFTGGTPTNVTLVVSGTLNGTAPLGLTDTFTFAGVPPGTYTLSVVATNASGASAPSNSVTLTFPAPCSGAPQAPTNFVAYAEGSTLFVRWDPPLSGAAPFGYVLNATGTYAASVLTPLKALSGPVPRGTYILDVQAANRCGQSPGSAPQTVVVP